MSMDKKQAARQAAAKYSTNPPAAFVEYGKLIGQIDPTFLFDEPNRECWEVIGDLNQEMLELLPQYRHPANDEFAEWMIFIDPDTPYFKGKMYQEPEFLRLLKKEDIPADIIKKTEEYVKKSEMAKLDLREGKHELRKLEEIFEEVSWIYNEESWTERSEKRNALVVQALGLSTGQARKRFDKKEAYIEYLTLVRKKGLSRHDATLRIKRQQGCKSPDAALKMLHDYRKHVLDMWKEKYPKNLPIVKKWHKGFVLPNRISPFE